MLNSLIPIDEAADAIEERGDFSLMWLADSFKQGYLVSCRMRLANARTTSFIHSRSNRTVSIVSTYSKFPPPPWEGKAENTGGQKVGRVVNTNSWWSIRTYTGTQ